MLPLPPNEVLRVEFYKRDELTTDLICCEVTAKSGDVYFAHEDKANWPELLRQLSDLPGFDQDWFAKVSQPPFEECSYVAYASA